MAKRCSFVIACILIVSSFGIAQHLNASQDYCPFCDPVILQNQKFYEDDTVLALYTHKPIVPGHCLVIPKRHVERFEDLVDQEVLAISGLIKQVNLAARKAFSTSPYLLLQKNGKEVGQSVPHLHFHYIPRKAGDSSIFLFVVKMWLSDIKKPISSKEMQKAVSQMQKAMSSL